MSNTALPAKRRLAPEARAQLILEEATRFFAEHGFGGQIADLAARMGVSHTLIFHYFGTKQNLIDQVYQNVFYSQWSEDWARDLSDRSVPLQRRVESFYFDYLDTVDNPLWIRIAMHAALAGEHMPKKGIAARNRLEQVLEIIMRELRVFRGLPEEPPFDPLERELAWHLHSSIVYFLLRKHVLEGWHTMDRRGMVRRLVANFFGEFKPGGG